MPTPTDEQAIQAELDEVRDKIAELKKPKLQLQELEKRQAALSRELEHKRLREEFRSMQAALRQEAEKGQKLERGFREGIEAVFHDYETFRKQAQLVEKMAARLGDFAKDQSEVQFEKDPDLNRLCRFGQGWASLPAYAGFLIQEHVRKSTRVTSLYRPFDSQPSPEVESESSADWTDNSDQGAEDASGHEEAE
jgi:seryl-tRNA synthetase